MVVARAANPDYDRCVRDARLRCARVGLCVLLDLRLARALDGGRRGRSRVGRSPIFLADRSAVARLVDVHGD